MERQERIILTVVGAVVRLLHHVISIKFKRLDPGQKRYLTNVKTKVSYLESYSSRHCLDPARCRPRERKKLKSRGPHIDIIIRWGLDPD